ncbi:MAG TPA: helix-turn-helix domain-containing protein [Rhizomicrobium sp.]|nr:helix-turn-helix domain-containing protein [Rhizomicrobium sp.]
MTDKPRRSAGMRGSPLNARPEHQSISATPPKPRGEAQHTVRVSTSPYAKPPGAHSVPKPKVLMGEVAAPRGQEIGRRRDAFRAFMIARHLRPTEWARAAGVAPGEILAFLTGKARAIAPATLAKLAAAANVTPQDLLG